MPARRRTPRAARRPVPLPALINLIVPAGTLLGWSAAPAQAGAWGLLDRDETRAIVSRRAATRAPAGASPSPPPTAPPSPTAAPAASTPPARRPDPADLADTPATPATAAQLAELLRRLNLTFTPIARGSCDHAQAEEQLHPEPQAQHLVRARTATCDAPGCQAQAVNADLDHTRPGPTAPPINATSPHAAGRTIAPSRHLTGRSSSSHPASPAGRCPPAAPTSPPPPGTTPDRSGMPGSRSRSSAC